MRRAVAVVLVAVAGCSGGLASDNTAPSTPRPRASAEKEVITAAAVTEWFSCQEQLPIIDTVVYTAETDPNQLLGRPSQYSGKSTLVDRRTGRDAEAGVDAGASLEVFDELDDAAERLAYLDEVTAVPMFAEYHWLRGRVLLRVAHTLTPDEAADYEDVFAALPEDGVPVCGDH